MPGWWFTIESTTTRHFIQQFKIAVENALRSKADVRAIMRARATKQRFPVKQWVEDLEKLQSSAIELSHKEAAREQRPTLDSRNTPTILETSGMLSILQSRFPKSSRPRPPIAQAQGQGKALTTISEGGLPPGTPQTTNRASILTDFSDGSLLATSNPGLGSKMGPSSRRKAPPPLVLSTSSNAVATLRKDFAVIRRQSDGEPVSQNQQVRIPHSPSSPNLRTGPKQKEPETTKKRERPKPKRSRTMPPLQPNDRKAPRLLGMQLDSNRASALVASNRASTLATRNRAGKMVAPSRASTLIVSDRASALNLSNHASTLVAPSRASAPNMSNLASALNVSESSPSSSEENSSQPPSTPRTPDTPTNGFYTPPESPTPPPSNISRAGVSFPNSSTGTSSVSDDQSDSSATSISASNSYNAAKSTGAAKFNVIHTPQAVDSFPSLGPHYFPYGGIPVLSASDVKGEKPDNILQNVTPFFSDPEKEYENKFIQNLKNLNGKNSANRLCIEEYLLKSEKSWFEKLRAAELSKRSVSSSREEPAPEAMAEKNKKKKAKDDEFGLGSNHKPPSGVRRLLRIKIGDWPIYSFLLAFVREPTSYLDGERSCLL